MSHVVLVARREIRERMRSRSWQVSTVVAMFIVTAAIVLPTLASNPLQSTIRVGLVGRDRDEVDASLRMLGTAVGENRIVYRDLADRAAAERALTEDEIHLALVGREEIVLKEPLQPNDFSAKVRLARTLSFLPAVTRAPVPITSALAAPERERRNPLPVFMGTALIYGFMFVYGGMILGGVAEEKGSRVIEVLLSAVRPRQLLAGKVIGIGVVALVQGVLVAGTTFVSLAATGRSPFAGTAGAQVLQMLGWFLLAYAFYACAFAAAGSTVSRQEEAQNALFPIMVPVLVAYFAASSTLSGGEDSRLLRVLSFLPPTAPIAMPMRSALGFASGTQVVVAIALTLAGTLAVVRLGGRIYERSILRMGARVKLRDAWRSAA